MIAKFLCKLWLLTCFLFLNCANQDEQTAFLTAHPWKTKSFDYSDSPELGSLLKSGNDKINELFTKLPSTNEPSKRVELAWDFQFNLNGSYERVVSYDFATALTQKGKWKWVSVDTIQCSPDSQTPDGQEVAFKIKQLTKSLLVFQQEALVNGGTYGTFDTILVPGVK